MFKTIKELLEIEVDPDNHMDDRVKAAHKLNALKDVLKLINKCETEHDCDDEKLVWVNKTELKKRIKGE